MRRFLKDLHRSERGFTLIELLVIVGILGVISTVVMVSVGTFLGSGKIEAANSEVHQVQTAVIAHTTADNQTECDGFIGPTRDTCVPVTDTDKEVSDYLLDQGRLQAEYTIAGGKIINATLISGSKWTGLSFDSGNTTWTD